MVDKFEEFERTICKGTYSYYFYRLTDKKTKITNHEVAYCKQCHSSIKTTCGNTSGLKSHLSTHNIEKSANSNINGFLRTETTPDEKMKIKNDLLDLIVGCNLSFNLINDHNFIKYSNYLIQLNNRTINNALPDESTIRKGLKNRFNVLYEKFLEEISMIRFLSISTDMWYNPINNSNYIGVALHFLDKNNELTIKRLGIDEIVLKSGDDIKNYFNDLLEKLGFDNEFVTYCTDNGSNFINAFKKDKHVSCAAHNINLVLKNAVNIMDISNNNNDDNYDDNLNKNIFDLHDAELEEEDDLDNDEENMGNSILSQTNMDHEKEFSYNVNSVGELITLCSMIIEKLKRKHINKTLNLKSNVLSRFNSNFLMIDSIIKKLPEVEQILNDNGLKEFATKLNVNKLILTQLHSILEHFDYIIALLSSETEITINRVFVFKYYLLEVCAANVNDKPLIKQLKFALINLLESKYKYNAIHLMTTFLSPEYKFFSFVDDKNVLSNISISILNLMVESEIHLNESKKKYIFITNSNHSFNNSNINNNDIRTMFIKPNNSNFNYNNNCSINKTSLIDKFRKNKNPIDDGSSIQMNKIAVKDEFNSYLNYYSDVLDPIAFWCNKKHQCEFPRLYYCFQLFMHLPATETTVERMFSTCKRMCTSSRYNLKNSNIRMMSFINFESK